MSFSFVFRVVFVFRKMLGRTLSREEFERKYSVPPAVGAALRNPDGASWRRVEASRAREHAGERWTARDRSQSAALAAVFFFCRRARCWPLS